MYNLVLSEILYLDEFSQFEMSMVNLNNNTNFYAGNLHRKFCLESEKDQVEAYSIMLEKKRSNCLFLDVGMNDGFYTNMAAAYGI